MDKRQIRQLEMLVRVRDFGAAHGDRFPEPSRARQSFAAVGEAVERLTAHAVSQMAATRWTSPARVAARAELENALLAISRTARVIEARDPTFTNMFELPRRR